jgi:hypothetical protein
MFGRFREGCAPGSWVWSPPGGPSWGYRGHARRPRLAGAAHHHRGRGLRHLHHDQRTPEGEDLVRQVRSFRRDLRRLKTKGDQEALAKDLSRANTGRAEWGGKPVDASAAVSGELCAMSLRPSPR